MTIATSVPWWLAIGLAVTFWLIGSAWGASQSHKDAMKWIRHFVSADAGQRTAIRDLYRAEGYADPDFYAETEPEEQPRWYRRAWAALQRQQRPGAQAVDEAEAVQVSAVELDAEPEHSSLAEGEAPNFVVDPNPSTAPIPPLPGPSTVPDMKAAAKVAPPLSFEEWQRDFQARVERDMAEIRGES